MRALHRAAARRWGAPCPPARTRPLSTPAAAPAAPAPAPAANPLLALADDPLALPDYAAISPSHVGPAVEALIARMEEGVRGVVAAVSGGAPPSWGHVEALEAARDGLERAWGAVSHLNGVANSPALRAAVAEALPSVLAAGNRVKQDADLHRMHAALLARLGAPGGGGTPGQLRALQWAVRGGELAGVGLPPAQREAVTRCVGELATLSQTFDSHVMDSTAAFSLLLTQPAEVAGLPPGLRAQLAAAAAGRGGHPGATPDGGPWLVTLDPPVVRPFLAHAARRNLREAVYRAHVARASAGGPGGAIHDNDGVLRAILAKRAEQAALLGFPDWAAVSVASKMVPSVGHVRALLGDLRAAAAPAAARELGELGAFAREHAHLEAGGGGSGGGGGYALAQWDVPFWAERMLEARYGVDDDAVMRYFPLPAVLEGLWGTLRDVFGVTAAPAPPGSAPPTWHPDAGFWRVADASTGAPLAGFYLDAFARSGTKRGGAWMDVAVGRTANPALGGGAPGGVRPPVAQLVCNQAPPLPGGAAPSLMRHSDVLTLWHEVGHGLQHMLTTVPEGDVAGIAGVEWDAVELPSQMLEEFAWHPAVLARMSRHADSGERIPPALVARMRAARRHMGATAMLRQLYFAATDLAVHTAGGGEWGAPAPGSPCGFDPFAVQRGVAGPGGFALLPPIPEDRFLCSFSHIFSGGYAAGYWSYKHAEVLSADAWGAFEEAGLGGGGDDGVLASPAVAAVGRRFRDTVLALGGSVHPGEVFRRFRGRDPQVGPLLAQAGLA